MLWGWEHGGTWASGDYFPPQEGWASFGNAIQRVRQAKGYAYLFIRAESAREGSPAWGSAWGPQAALRAADGQRVGREDILMCLESEEWLAHLRDVTATLAARGVSLIQLDGLPWAPLRVCYSKKHRHGTATGCSTRPYQVVQNLSGLRSSLHADYPDCALSGEGGAELYLPVLDVFHSRDCWAEASDRNVATGCASVLPLFHFVYHQNIVFLDQYNLGLWRHLGGARYHNLAVGRCFIWGETCSYNMQSAMAAEGLQPVFGLLKRCAEARVGFLKDFLVFGKMLLPPKVEGPLMQAVSQGGKFGGVVPSVLSSAWQSERGDVALIVLNVGNATLRTSLDWNPYSRQIKRCSKVEIYRDSKLERTVRRDPGNAIAPVLLQPLECLSFVFRNDARKSAKELSQ